MLKKHLDRIEQKILFLRGEAGKILEKLEVCKRYTVQWRGYDGNCRQEYLKFLGTGKGVGVDHSRIDCCVSKDRASSYYRFSIKDRDKTWFIVEDHYIKC